MKGVSFVNFYDWETGLIVRKVDVAATNTFWSTSDTVCIVTLTSFFILKLKRHLFQAEVDSGVYDMDEGCEDALEFVCEVPEMYFFTKFFKR